MANSYCDYVASGKASDLHIDYHDREYGFPIDADSDLLERLTLEIFQAGLSWDLILKRRPFLRMAFQNYEVEQIIAWTPEDVDTFLQQPGVIKNRMKAEATIFNARRIDLFREEGSSFDAWLRAQPSQDLAGWVKTLRKEFKFVGPEVVREFLVSIGLMEGAHDPLCPIFERYRRSVG